MNIEEQKEDLKENLRQQQLNHKLKVLFFCQEQLKHQLKLKEEN
jgi:hypothetical protein